MPKLYMVIERFKNADAIPVYRRLRDRGRLAPEGLRCISSWVDEGCTKCYQVMETTDHALLDDWMSRWRDIVEFQVCPVVSSQEAAEKMGPRLLSG